MKLRIRFCLALAALLLPLCIQAADLTFPTYFPQDTDSVTTLQQRQAAAIAALKSLGFTSAARIPALTIAVASGSVATGARSVTIAISADFTGSILGATVAGASSPSAYSWTAPPGDTLTAIAYTRTAGTLTILEVR